MNENDVREMFRRRAMDLRPTSATPSSLLRRTGRRELLTAAGGAAIALLLVLGSIAGLRSLGSPDEPQPGDVEPTVTKSINGITITYPEGWFAVDPVAIGIEPSYAPRTLPSLVLALTRDDPQIQGVLGCPGLAHAPAGQLVMTVQETGLATSGEASAPWPVPLQTMGLDTGEPGGCYGGWTFARASWTAAGRSFEARLGFSSVASDTDRKAILKAYSSMTFSPGSVAANPGVTLGYGTAPGGVTWSLTATLDGPGVSWMVQTNNGGFGSGQVPAEPKNPNLEIHDTGPDGIFVVAILPGDVSSVVVTSDGNVIGDIGLFPVPNSWGNAQFAVIPLPAGHGEARFLDLHGAQIYPPEHIPMAARQPG